VLELVGRPTRLVVRINPEDIERTKRDLPALAARFAGAAHAELLPDASLSRGSIVAATEAGEIDATIETQLDRIVESLLPGAREIGGAKGAPASAPNATAGADAGGVAPAPDAEPSAGANAQAAGPDAPPEPAA
jgi:hypothetical protein